MASPTGGPTRRGPWSSLGSRDPLRPRGLRLRSMTSHENTLMSPAAFTEASTHPYSAESDSAAWKVAHQSVRTPTESTHKKKKPTWVSSASKHLGFTKTRHQNPLSTKPDTVHEYQDAQVLSPAPWSYSSASRSQIAAKPTLQSPSYLSPHDKPLPSLPVASVKAGSPVRRSLIDCSERPLRRSISPTLSGDSSEEEWPVMEPAKPAISPASHTLQPPVNHSLGESVIEGMRGLKIGDDEGKRSDVITNKPFGARSDGAEAGKEPKRPTDHELVVTTSDRPLSSSQLPKPRDSMLQSLARHMNSPSVRQTRTSAMRLRRTIGKKTWGSSENNAAGEGRLIPVAERGHGFSLARHNPDSGGGAVRSNSRGRLAVTHRGSPYTVSSRGADPKLNNGAEGGRSKATSEAPAQSTAEPFGFYNGKSKITTPDSFKATRGVYQSSIPLPTRLSQQERDFKDNLSPSSGLEKIRVDDEGRELRKGDGNFYKPSDTSASAQELDDPSCRVASHSHSAPKPGFRDAEDAVSIAKSEDANSLAESNASGGTVRCYSTDKGFRVRHLGQHATHGPTLRVADSANKILLGDDAESDIAGNNAPISPLRRKMSAPDLRSSAVVKGYGRRCSVLSARPTSSPASSPESSMALDRPSIGDDTPAVDARPITFPAVAKQMPYRDASAETPTVIECNKSSGLSEKFPRDHVEHQGTPPSTHGDWPCKDFTEFTPAAKAAQPEESNPSLGRRAASETSKTSKASKAIIRAVPTEEVSPFLFQDLEKEKVKHGNVVGVSREQGAGLHSTTPAPANQLFPPRTSSRKPKPPPILVSPPQPLQSAGSFPNQAGKALEVKPDELRQPKNVKTFSQSTRLNNKSTGAENAPETMSPGSESNSKKVISNIRGLFHKRSIENTLFMGSAGKTGGIGSIRRKPVSANKMSNPLLLNPEPETHSSGENRSALAGKTVKSLLRNPFLSPTTPFCADTSPLSSSFSASKATTDDTTTPQSQRPASPTTTAVTTSPPSLSLATRLTHNILDIARDEADPQRKSTLIELSRSLVEMVSAARDAEKANERAKIEAVRAELCWLKVQKAITILESTVKELAHTGHSNM